MMEVCFADLNMVACKIISGIWFVAVENVLFQLMDRRFLLPIALFSDTSPKTLIEIALNHIVQRSVSYVQHLGSCIHCLHLCMSFALSQTEKDNKKMTPSLLHLHACSKIGFPGFATLHLSRTFHQFWRPIPVN